MLQLPWAWNAWAATKNPPQFLGPSCQPIPIVGVLVGPPNRPRSASSRYYIISHDEASTCKAIRLLQQEAPGTAKGLKQGGVVQ